MKTTDILKSITKKTAPGRTPSFSEAQVLMALEVIKDGPVGRGGLSRILHMGGGVTRTLVRHLDAKGLIDVTRSGIILSKRGESVFSEICSIISKTVELPRSSLTVGPVNTAVCVKGRANKVRMGLDQRDEAIKAGGMGATTLVFTDKRLFIPGVDEKFLSDDIWIFDVIQTKMEPEENDVIIIGSAKNMAFAELAAKTAALDLLRRES